MADVDDDLQEQLDAGILLLRVVRVDNFIIDFIHVEDGLGSVTDDEDEDNAGEEGGHGGVPPVAAGPGHHAAVVSSGAGDCSEDQPVEDGEDQHWQQAHHNTVGSDVSHVVLLRPHSAVDQSVLIIQNSHQFYVITRVGDVGGGVEDRAAGLNFKKFWDVVQD